MSLFGAVFALLAEPVLAHTVPIQNEFFLVVLARNIILNLKMLPTNGLAAPCPDFIPVFLPAVPTVAEVSVAPEVGDFCTPLLLTKHNFLLLVRIYFVKV